MDSALHPSGTFYLLALFALLGFVFILFWFKESMGLTEKEKKNLYSPKNLQGDGIIETMEEEFYHPD